MDHRFAYFGGVSATGATAELRSLQTLELNQRVHLAGVLDKKELRFYVNGKLAERRDNQRPFKVFPVSVAIGVNPGAAQIEFFDGLIDHVRISKSARYDKDFSPPNRFDSDKDTLALYQFDEGSGDVLKDSSGNGHHGKIIDAKWVKVDGTPIAPLAPQFALQFQKGDLVECPKLDANTRDFTLEGWFTAEPDKMFVAGYIQIRQAALGIHPPGGWRLSIYNEAGAFKGGMQGPEALASIWTHVATVCQGDRVTIFVNGKAEKREDGKQLFPIGGYPFQLSDKNVVGSMREVRISKVARYNKDFAPAQRFEPDADTLALYHFDEGSGDVLNDSSGNNHHGKIVGAKWVKVDGSSIDSSAPQITNALGMEFVRVPKGKSWLGGGAGKPGERPVEFKDDFYLGTYEVTHEEWEKVMGSNPSYFTRAHDGREPVKAISDADLKRFPVENLSWDDAQEFLRRLNAKAQDTGWLYRLPTTDEWEYACRGGPLTKLEDSGFNFYLNQPANTLTSNQANVKETGLRRTCPVGSYSPNRLGLHDMHGNVREWCADERTGADGSSRRVNRLGGWSTSAVDCHAKSRDNTNPPTTREFDLGLRVARVRAGNATTFTNSLGMEFVRVPKGKSWLGGGGVKPGTQEVEFQEDFYLGKYEVTQDEWQTIVGNNPSGFSRGGSEKNSVKGVSDDDLKRFPIESILWEETQTFLAKLNERDKVAGWTYRLPTEAEWEYACRGGPLSDPAASAFDFYLATPTNQLRTNQANFKFSGWNRTGPVGSFAPNSLGLCDMHGNVWEWCDGQFPPDPKDPQKAPRRVDRGGGWANEPSSCTATSRYEALATFRISHVGLRVARVPVSANSPP